jgi:hypothetical protein
MKKLAQAMQLSRPKTQKMMATTPQAVAKLVGTSGVGDFDDCVGIPRWMAEPDRLCDAWAAQTDMHVPCKHSMDGTAA